MCVNVYMQIWKYEVLAILSGIGLCFQSLKIGNNENLIDIKKFISNNNNNNSKFIDPTLGGILVGLLQIPCVYFFDSQLGNSSTFVFIPSQIIKRIKLSLLDKYPRFKAQSTKWWQFWYVIGSGIGVILVKKQFNDPGMLHIVKDGPKTSAIGKNEISAFVGGFSIVFGSRIAAGCDFGNPVSGVAVLSLQAIYTVLPYVLGGLLGAKVSEYI